jgi:hypothetical protein
MTGLALFCGMKAVGVPQVVGWFGVVFFAGASAATFSQLLRTKPTVTLDRSGMTLMHCGFERVSWAEIESVSIGKIESQRLLFILLKDEDGYISRASALRRAAAGANHALGYPALVVNFSELSPGIDAACKYIRDTVPGKVTA